ncbi:hypothetical protein Goshw_020578 [Gossypium schwendimanii]|uniref:RRM domain-containing protein n=1 Tax=Gossypium schwendimanii TaxID=34291 RepID=A0A7J9MZF6_GOSSC|nr:hypothetical protein [Gossypium schwendimanii]
MEVTAGKEKMPRYDDRRGGTRLYVGHLSSRTRSRDLEDMFSRYGRFRVGMAKLESLDGFRTNLFQIERIIFLKSGCRAGRGGYDNCLSRFTLLHYMK